MSATENKVFALARAEKLTPSKYESVLKTVSTAVADVFNDTGQLAAALRLGGENQPAFDRLPAEAMMLFSVVE